MDGNTAGLGAEAGLRRVSPCAGDDDGFWSELRAARRPDPVPQVRGYSELERVATGGQGVVYRARTRPGGVPVALKRVNGGRWARELDRERIEREARLIGRLRHPNIVQVLALETVGEAPAVVTRWIHGERLDRWLKRREPAAGVRSRVLSQVASAVAHCHANGVVHRDLKPANILVDAANRAYLLDFGIARRAEASGSDSVDASGTPAFAAPEQRMGFRACLPPVDVYALGVLGRLLLGADATSGERALLERAHAADPRRRPAHGGEFARDLNRTS